MRSAQREHGMSQNVELDRGAGPYENRERVCAHGTAVHEKLDATLSRLPVRRALLMTA